MKLKELLQGIPVLSATADMDMEISGVSYDSRSTAVGDLFVAVTGYAVDGHRFIPIAAEKGAAAVLCEKIPEGEIPYVQVENTRRGLAVLGLNWFGHPAKEMTLVAVTGTNGKTTTTYLLKSVLEQNLGAKVGLIGTNQNMIGEEVIPTERTTPESFEVQRLFRRMADAGCSHVVMEVSSHALAEDRVYGVDFAVGMFTNLTQDHLDFHKTMENYCDTKALLFRQCGVGIINADDAWAELLMKDATCRRVDFAEKANAALRAENITLAADHVAYDAVSAEERVSVFVPIPGGFNVYNTLGVIAAAKELGVSLEQAAATLRNVGGVKGRVEVVPTPGMDCTVLIDYAHSPDGLENVLKSAKGFAKGRVVALFGCGGDRDATKRPIMGRIAAELADFVIVTSDNPRTEEPMAIIRDILPGLEGMDTPHTVVENRVEAIHYALAHAQKDDVIVLCGKGHETYQEIHHVKHHLDEREVVADFLKKH